MARFPVDAPRERVIIAMGRENPDGTQTSLTMPNHRRIKGATLRTILTQAGIPRDAFWRYIIEETYEV